MGTLLGRIVCCIHIIPTDFTCKKRENGKEEKLTHTRRLSETLRDPLGTIRREPVSFLLRQQVLKTTSLAVVLRLSGALIPTIKELKSECIRKPLGRDKAS